MSTRPAYLLILLIAITLGVYYPTIFAPFNSLDDQVYIQILLNQNHFSFAEHFRPGGASNYFRPLLSLSFQIDKYVGGLEESFMHFFNIVIHTINAVLIYFLAAGFSLFTEHKERLLPWLAALIFALHPLNTEAVNWILARTDLLAGMFVFASLICLLKSVRQGSLSWGAVGSVLYLCGAMCKETALFALPGVFLVMVWKSPVRPVTWPVRWFIPAFYLAASAGYFTMRFAALSNDRGLGNTAELIVQASGVTAPQQKAVFPLFDAVGAVLKLSGFYAVKLFQPFPLNFAITRVPWFYAPVGILLVVILLVLVWKRQPVGIFFVASAGIGVSALFVAFTGLAWTPVAERYMYVPSGPFAIALVYGGYRWTEAFSRQKAVAATVCLILFFSAWATAQRNILWQDNLTLYEDTVHKSPDFPHAKNQLAMALYTRGRGSEAETLLRNTQLPSSQLASLNHAALYIDKGDYQAARDVLVDRLKNPGILKSRILEMLVKNASEMAERTTDEKQKYRYYSEMIVWLNELESRTGNPFINYRKGRVYLLLGDRKAAQVNFDIAAKGLPEDSDYKAAAVKLARDLVAPGGSESRK